MDGDEYTKLLGYKSYWEYESFENPVGTGYVEKSQGNFVYTQTDAEIENEKLPVKIDRTYNSQASTVSSLGLGWNHSYDIELLNINEADKLIDRKALRDRDRDDFPFRKTAGWDVCLLYGKIHYFEGRGEKGDSRDTSKKWKQQNI